MSRAEQAAAAPDLHAAIAEALGRPPADPALFALALRHASVLEGRSGADNERLEFLGDRVLGVIVAEHLFTAHPELGEAEFAPRLNSIVNRSACAEAARRFGAARALELSPAEEAAGGREKPGILADAAEAVVAAVYLDGGLEAARRFVLLHWGEAIRAAAHAGKDAKTALQEWAAAARQGAPVYTVLAREGPDHAPSFTVAVQLEGGALSAQARGASKREAERLAAAALLARLQPAP